MPKIFDQRLADYAESLNKLIENHEELSTEYEQDRVLFNAGFRKIMSRKIKPVVDRLLDEASANGHWVDLHTYATAKYLAYIHQCYTFNWRIGGCTTLSIVANYDYQKVFFVVEKAGISIQQALCMRQVESEPLYSWLKKALLYI